MLHINKTGTKQCSKSCECEAECRCPPNPCSKNNKYHDLFCPGALGEACGTGCGDRRCKCYKIETFMESSTVIVTSIGQVLSLNVSVKNVGNLDLCGEILVCFDINGVKSKEFSYKQEDTWLPVGSTLVLTKSYMTTARDFNLQALDMKVQAFVFAEKMGCISHWVRGKKMYPVMTIGGADISGSITQVDNGGDVTVTVTMATLAGTSVVNAVNATLVLPYPAGVVSTLTVSPGVTVDDVARTVTMTVPVLVIGSTQVFTFTYVGNPGEGYTWSGVVTADTFDPNHTNNSVQSTIVIA